MTVVNVLPPKILKTIGSQVTFKCIVSSSIKNLTVFWTYPNGSLVSIQNNVLLVTEVTDQSEGSYICTVFANSSENMRLSAEASLKIGKFFGLVVSVLLYYSNFSLTDTRCSLDDGYLVRGSSRMALSLLHRNRTADVIVLVDESGSMSLEHSWISTMIKALDHSLQSVGIGITLRNYFGVVGFGDDCNNELNFARVLVSSSDELFVTADNISDFTTKLSVGGKREDGYSALNAAVESYQFRNGARLFILITDEDRDVLDANITQNSVFKVLLNERIILNAVVNEEFSAMVYQGLGIDHENNLFLYDPSARSLFRMVSGVGLSVPDSPHGTTNTDYTQLALKLNGSAWDIGQLRQGD